MSRNSHQKRAHQHPKPKGDYQLENGTRIKHPLLGGPSRTERRTPSRKKKRNIVIIAKPKKFDPEEWKRFLIAYAYHLDDEHKKKEAEQSSEGSSL
jgi:hypothetical protein